MGKVFLIFLAGGAAIMNGCAPHRGDLASQAQSKFSHQAASKAARVTPEVPFFPDNTDQCGPSALASVMNFWGVPAEPQSLRSEMYVERVKGTFPTDLVATARARGMKAGMYEGTLENLKSELETGHRVIAFLNLGYAFLPQGHYVVLTGYDDGRQGFYAHSGLGKNQFIPYRRFSRHWEKTGRCAILVLPAQIPDDTHEHP